MQGLKLKKSSGHLLAINWKNIVPIGKFLVTSLYNVNDAAHSVMKSIRFWLFEKVTERGWYKFGGELALFMRFGTYFMTKAKQYRMKR